VLSLCEVEIFSPDGVGAASCNQNIDTKVDFNYLQLCVFRSFLRLNEILKKIQWRFSEK